MQRREFLTGALSLGSAARLSGSQAGPKLGVDLFSLRQQGWDAHQFLEYCAKHGARVVHFSEIRFLGSLEDGHVRKVGEHARRLGVELEIGMRSICPTSTAFDPKQGTAEEQLLRVVRAAGIAGSKLVRAFLGNSNDRKTPGGIEARIEDTVKVLRAVRTRVMDAGMKVAIENHSGDMQARELKELIVGAGTDFVGACFDSGNPCWTLEDPHLTLETLAPYVLTSHIRDSALWDVEEGTAVRWTRTGEGNVDIGGLMKKYLEKCPGKTMSLEIIVTGPRVFGWRNPEFWKGYENVRAAEFARFLGIAAKGKPLPGPAGGPKEQAAERERADFEASLEWTRKYLGV